MLNQQWYSLSILCCLLFCVLLATTVCADEQATTDHHAVLAELYTKTDQAYQKGRYTEGIGYAEQAYTYAVKNLGKTHSDTLTFMNNLAFLYSRQGRYGEAEPLYKEALQLREQVLGRDHPDTLSSINNLAALYSRQGRYGEAEPLYKEALQLREQVLGRDHPDTLSSINNLAALYSRQGRYGEAEPLYKEALQLREQVLGRDHPDTLSSINNLAALYSRQGRYGEAEPLYKEALQLSEQVLGRDHPDTLISINNLAALYSRQGRYGEAEPLYKEALQLREQVLGRDHPDTLSSINNLAFLYSRQGRYGETEPLYKEALQLKERELGESHPSTLLSHSNYTILMINMGKPIAAFRLLKNMEERLFSRSFQELYSSSEGRVRRLFLKNISAFQDLCFSYAQKFPEREHLRYAADVALRWKQIYAEEYAFQHRLMNVSDDPAVKALRQELAQLRSEFSRTLHQPDAGQTLGKIMQAMNLAESALREKARLLKPELSVSSEDAERVLRRLPEGSALVEFKRFSLLDFTTGNSLSQNWAASLLLADMNAEQQIFFENLGSNEKLVNILSESKNPMKGLYTMFFSRFEEQLKNVDTLYIAPDGFLNVLPLAALKTPDGRYLAQQFRLKQVQSGRDLLAASSDKPANILIAMGGVDYGQLPGGAEDVAIADDVKKSLEILNPNLRAGEELEQGMKELPHSREEVEMIERLFKINDKDGEAQVYTKLQAAESLLKNLEYAPRILHLSTHGFYLKQEEDSLLAEAEPMALSGLALAGANQGLKGILDANGDDGLLYSLEVLGLNLQGTELVSLSACETGKGVIDYSEGVYGLIRAFRTAGARHVLMTLSSVGDKASKEFMVKFYETWLGSPEGTSPADALHDTRLYFINHEDPAYSDPAFWSPYVMVGP